MRQLIFIAIGGSLGAVSRYLISSIYFNTLFPIGTLAVNIIGSLLIGILYNAFEQITVPHDLKIFLIIGFLGALTTFSTFSIETITLLKDGEIKYFIFNILLNNFLCLTMTIFGIYISRVFFKLFVSSN